MNVNDAIRLINNYQTIPKTKRFKTFMEISGFPHYENVASNILQFYLNPLNEHGLFDLVLNSLMKIADNRFKYENKNGFFKIDREVKTLKGGRLDLLIQTEKYVIGIENKIFHFLNNDLEDYRETIDDYGRNEKISINILLSLNKLSTSDEIQLIKTSNFINITYNELFTSIKSAIGNYLSDANTIYWIFLNDFMKSITNLTSTNMENFPLNNFFQENGEKVEDLIHEFKIYFESLYNKVLELMEYLPKAEYAKYAVDSRPYNGLKEENLYFHSVVYEYKIEDVLVWVHCKFNPDGWRIELMERFNAKSPFLKSNILKIEGFLPKPFSEYDSDNIFTLERFPMKTDLKIIAESLGDILKRFDDYIKLKHTSNPALIN